MSNFSFCFVQSGKDIQPNLFHYDSDSSPRKPSDSDPCKPSDGDPRKPSDELFSCKNKSSHSESMGSSHYTSS